MNGYIINPSVFYWVSVLHGIKIFGVVLCLLGTAGLLFLLICYMTEGVYDDDDINYAKWWLKRLVPVAVVGVLILIFIPSKETMFEMLIAKYSTYENVGMTVDGIKSVVDYIIESLKSLK